MKEFKLSTGTVLKLADKFRHVVGTISDDDRKNGINKMLNVLGDRFFSCPASPKLSYHNCFPGGLLEHSLRVYSILSEMYTLNDDDDSVKLCSLFHDLGKVGTVDDEYYIFNDSSWHRENLGVMYKTNTDMVYLSTADRSIKLLTDFGVKLSDEEWQSIKIHDGQYVYENKSYAHKETWLALLLHQADMQACKFENERWESIQ